MPSIKELEKEMLEKGDSPKKTEKNGKEPRIKYSANFEGLCDLVRDGDEVRYLMDDGTVKDSVIIEDQEYFPPKQENLDHLIPYLENVLKEASRHVKSDVTDTSDTHQGCRSCLNLYKDLVKYHRSISSLPFFYLYSLLALFDFHTYLIEKFNFSPIIYFFADRERGKTRTAKGLIYVARRGVMTETLREANLIRWGKDHRATILFDVKDFGKKLMRAQSEDLVYGRAERGVVASRVLFPERGAFQDTVRFEVFGPTIVTSNRMIDDIGMSRMIVIEMKPSDRIFYTEPVPGGSLALRERLTGMRLAHMNDKFVTCRKEETGRIEDMLIGYKSMIMTLFPKKLPVYYKIKKIIKEQKKESSLDSFEAGILQIVIDQAMAVEEGSLTLTFDHICSIYNEGKPEKFNLRPQSLSKALRGIGFISKRNNAGNKRGIFYDIELIKRLRKIYGLDDEAKKKKGHPPSVSEASVKSDSSVTAKSQADTVKELFDI